MFTGIVEEVATVAEVAAAGEGARITVEANATLAGLELGDSIAVNGACLTAVAVHEHDFEFEAVAETLRATSLGDLGAGDRVNLERAMRADGRFDGHIVQGHVDGTGTISAIDPAPNATLLRVSCPENVLGFCVPKGSITIDGISLTIVDVSEAEISVAIIPHTWDATNLSLRRAGDKVNLEADVIAKYVERLCSPRSDAGPATAGESE